MKQDILNKIFMGTLILLNVSLLAFVFIKPGAEEPRKGRKSRQPVPELIADILSLTDEQKKEYRRLGRLHHEENNIIERQKSELMKAYFAADEKKGNPEDVEVILQNILDLEKKRIEGTSEHFEALKSICTEEQLEHFPKVIHALFGEMLRRGPGNRNGKRPPPPPPR